MPYSGLNNCYLTSNPYLNYGYNFPAYDFTQNSNFNYGYYPSTNPFDTTSNYSFNNWNFNNWGIPSTDINYLMGNVPITNNPTPATQNNPTFTGKEQTQEEKKGLSKGAKWGIGIAVATAVALGVELVGFKGKHLKSLKQRFTKTPDAPDVPKNTGNKPSTETPASTPQPEAPKSEAPVPTPQHEVPKTETPSPDGPKSSQEAPKQDIPKNEVPKSETPKQKAPTSEAPKKSSSQLVDDGVKFTKLDEAKEYFESLGIKTVFKDGSENHLDDLNSIKDCLSLMKKNGVAIPQPESIIVYDWHNAEEVKQIFRTLNINERKADINKSMPYYWGTIVKGSDNKCHVLINSSFRGNYDKFIHEMGHIHHDSFRTSFWHTKGLSDREFIDKQLKVFGLSNIGLHDDGINLILREAGDNFAPSLFRNVHFNRLGEQAKTKIRNMFPDIASNDDYLKLFSFYGKDGKSYVINAKKMVDIMASESNVYAPAKTWENVAEIFEGLNKGKEYSDLVMLMYDINGGGRVPNLVIKGMKYDDYIESLYNNKDLIRKLRECIEIKEL